MSPLIPVIASFFSSVLKDRVLTKSSIDGAIVAIVAAGTAAAIAAGAAEPTVPAPDSVEGYVIALITALFGLYRILKKDKKS
jgi:hypothetical protein